MRASTLTLITLLGATTTFAQSTRIEEQHPWDWTLEERLTDRLNVARTESTGAQHIKSASASRGEDGTTPRRALVYDIDGSRNPELFLSFELFDMLLSGFTPDDAHRAKQRQFYSQSIRHLGYEPEMFWTSLASVSGNYLEIGNESCSSKECADARCTGRYDALEAARRLFGRENFNRLLYVVVAPTMKQSTATLDTGHRAALQREETGCR
ncbi:MAG: hypothetical protein QOE82_1421 [Thermoanaerobaculia bacterium]|jgi:hypothetical protein|nr:hypothetical protein [Thermoanaerobaculia bacterium]